MPIVPQSCPDGLVSKTLLVEYIPTTGAPYNKHYAENVPSICVYTMEDHRMKGKMFSF